MDFNISFLVDQSPREVFDAINNVRGWWLDEIEGDSRQLNDEFSVRFGDVHYSRQKLEEVLPERKVVWLVTDSRLNFLKDKSEWTGTRIRFDISRQGAKTHVQFTHKGLVPDVECFGACTDAWSFYVCTSLLELITTGKGQPTQKASL